MTVTEIAFLAIVQGLAELLPVSSSAHVILAQKWMGLDPSRPEMTFLLVMLHTGTMFAVLFYFRNRWKLSLVKPLVIATAATGILGFALKIAIEKITGEVEDLFKLLPLMGASLAAAGLLIFYSGRKTDGKILKEKLTPLASLKIGLVQGLCLPLRGFSRSGATISTALLLGIPRTLAEDFSFGLAVILTPPVIVLQLRRLLKSPEAQASLSDALSNGLIGMGFSFIAGLLALRFLSRILESGRWRFFGIYCLVFSGVVFASYLAGK